jgi:Bacterial PH domain/KAP family P-loop domain
MTLSRGTVTPSSVGRYLLPDENLRLTVRIHPAVLIGPILFVLAGLGIAIWLSISVAHGNGTAILVTWIVWGTLLVWLAVKVSGWWVSYLAVTSGRIFLISGLVVRTVSVMPLSNVTDLNTRRSLIGRGLGYGFLSVEGDSPNQLLNGVNYLPYPELIYSALWLGPNQGNDIKDSVLRICKVVTPVSPFQIVRLLEQTSGGATRDSPVVAQELLYSTVAAQLSQDASLERRPDLRSYLKDYHNDLQRRNNTERARLMARHLRTLAVTAVITLGSLLGIESYSSVKLISVNVMLILFIAAVSISLMLIMFIWLLTQRINSLQKQLASSAQRTYEEILNDFKAIASGLSLELRQSADPMLQLSVAPTMIELESARVQPFASFKDVIEFLESHRTSAVGIGGHRGIGKTALLRWIKYEMEPSWVVVYVSAPAVYDAADFMRTIFIVTAKEVIQKYSVVLRVGWLTSFIDPFRQLSNERRLGRLSQQALNSITGTRSDQLTTETGIAGKGITVQRGRQSTWTQREWSHPELVAAFKEYLEQYRLWGGRPIAITIDELDKLSKADEAIAAINGLKDLFHIPNTHFVVSVSEDALRRFAMRGVPFRDVFDSAFDTIVKLDVPSPDEAWEMLARRSGEQQVFPKPVALFCYAWSGGVPRDIIRVARACVNVRNRRGHPTGADELAPQIIRKDVADIVDDTINAINETAEVSSIDGLLVLQDQLRDEPSSLEAVLETYNIKDTASGKAKDAVILKRISKYVEIGATTSKFFSNSIYDLYAAHPEQVLCVVEDLARAKAALAMSTAEAEWHLSRARKKMESLVGRQK